MSESRSLLPETYSKNQIKEASSLNNEKSALVLNASEAVAPTPLPSEMVEFRPRIYSFPASMKSQYLSPSKQNPNWKRSEWSAPKVLDELEPDESMIATSRSSGGRSPLSSEHNSPRLSAAERKFLASPMMGEFSRLRSFSMGKSGEVVDCGFCYKTKQDPNRLSITSSTTLSSKQHKKLEGSISTSNVVLGGFNNNSSSDNNPFPPPGICLTSDSSFPSVAKNDDDPEKYVTVNVWFVGRPGVGKSSLLAHLFNAYAARDDDRSAGSMENEENDIAAVPAETDEDNVTRILLDREEIVVKFQETTSLDQVHQEVANNQQPGNDNPKRTINICLITYSIVSRTSFNDAKSFLTELSNTTGTAPTTAAILIGNKEDLQRKRQIKRQEGRVLSKIYRCPFLEASGLMCIHIEPLLSTLLSQIRQSLIHQAIATAKKSEHDRQIKGRKALNPLSKDQSSGVALDIFQTVKRRSRRMVRSCENLLYKLRKQNG